MQNSPVRPSETVSGLTGRQVIQKGIKMKDKAQTYLILGVVFLAVGITMLMTGAVSRTIAYGDFVLAFVFFGAARHKSKNSDGDT